MEFYIFKKDGQDIFINKNIKIVAIHAEYTQGCFIDIENSSSMPYRYHVDNTISEVSEILDYELPKTAIFKKSIDDLVLTVRSANCLKSDNIYYIDDLIQKTKFHLRNIPTLGKKSLREIEEELERHGLSLKT